jgi:hypothetical protein
MPHGGFWYCKMAPSQAFEFNGMDFSTYKIIVLKFAKSKTCGKKSVDI